MTFIEVLQHPLDVLDALGPIDDTGVDLDRSFGVDPRVLEPEPLKVFLCVEAFQLSKRIALPVPEPYLIAVGEEDEDVLAGLPLNVIGALLRLLLPDERVFCGAFGLYDGKRSAETVEEQVVDLLALQVVLQCLGYGLVGACEKAGLSGIDFEDYRSTVGDVPALLGKVDVYLLFPRPQFV